MTGRDDGITRRTAVVAGVAAASVRPAAAEVRPGDVPGPGFKKAYTDGPYGQIHYRIVRPANASKTSLVCLHPSPMSGIVYENWIVEMGKDRLALAPDTPGFGSSDQPPQPVEIPDFAKAMARFLDEMKLERVDVMGYHTGSFTSVELARSFPQRIRKVVMISAPIFNAQELEQLRKSNASPAQPYDVMLQRGAETWRKNGRGMFRDVPTDDRYIDFRLEAIRRFRTTSWGFRAAFNYDLAKSLSEVKQPVLVLNPEDDLWTQTPRAKPYLNKDSRIHDFPGWTHGHLDAHTVEMANVVRGFLDA